MSIKLIGAVGVKVKPDTSGFRGETRRGVLAELAGFDAGVPVTADVRANTRAARLELERLKRKYNNTEIDLRVKTNPGDLTRFRRALEGATQNALSDLTTMRSLMADMRRDGESLDRFRVSGPWSRASNEAKKLTEETRKALDGLRKMSEMRLDKHSGQMVKDLYRVHALADRPTTLMGGTINAFRGIDEQIKQTKTRIAELKNLLKDDKVSDDVLTEAGEMRRRLTELQSVYDGMLERHPEFLSNWHVRNQMSEQERDAVARLSQETDNLRIARENLDKHVPDRSMLEDVLGLSIDKEGLRDGVRQIVDGIDQELLSDPEMGREAWQEFWDKRFGAIDTYEARETLRRALQGDVFEESAWDRIRVDLDDDTAKKLQDEVERVKKLEQMFWRSVEGFDDDVELFLKEKSGADERDLDRLERDLREHKRRVGALWDALHGADADRARWAGEQQTMTRDEVNRVRRQVDRMREAQTVLYDVLAGRDGANQRWEDLRGLLDPTDVERVERSVDRLVRLESAYFDSLDRRDPLAGRRWADAAAGISEEEARKVRARVEELRDSADLFWEALSGNSRAGDEWERVSRGFSAEVVERIERDMRNLGEAERQYWRSLTSGDDIDKHRWRAMEVDLDPENVRRVKQKMERLKEELDGKVAQIKADLTGTGIVAAHMAWLTRTRVANIIPRVNAKALVMAEGALKSLAGFNIARSTWDTFERIFTRFDTFAAKSGLLSTAVLAIGDALGWAVATASSFIGSATRILNIGLMGPAAFSAFAAAITITKAAWQDFGEAAKGDNEALAQLPEQAQKAALAYRGMWEEIQKPIQERFWEGMGDSFERLASEVLPLVGEGLADTALHAGAFGRGVNEAMLELAKTGDLKIMFGNLSGMFDNLTRGAKPLFDTINRIGLRGSEYLPRFGEWMSDLAVSLNDFIVESDKAGKINQWIEDGVAETKNLGRAVNGATRMFYGLYRASVDVAGASTLSDVADTWSRAADVMNREPFKSRMGFILKGAVEGTREAGRGFRDWGEAMGESARFIHDIEISAGRLIRSVFDRITDITSNTRFQTGFLDMFDGLNAMFRDLDTTARNVAAIFGEIGTAAGEAFRNLPQLFDAISGAVLRVIEPLSSAFQALAPVLTGHLSRMISGIGIVLEPLARMVGGVAEAFAKWPSGVQTAVLSLGGLLVMAANINTAFRRVADTAWFGRLQARAIEAGRLTDNFRGKLSAWQVPAVLRAGIPNAFVNIGTQAQGASSKVRGLGTAIGGLKSPTGLDARPIVMLGDAAGGAGNKMGVLGTVGRGLTGFLGGPWGVALLGAAAVLGGFAAAQGAAEERTRELTATLDEQTGAATRLTQVDLAEKFEAAFKAAGTADEFYRRMGMSQADFVAAIAEGGDRSAEAMAVLRGVMAETAEEAKRFGGDGIHGPFTLLGQAAEEATGGLEEARREIEKIQGLHMPDIFRDFTRQIKEFSDAAGDARRQIDLLDQAFGRLRGDEVSLTEARHRLADTNASALGVLKDDKGNWLSLKGGIDEATGQINEQKQAWRDWRTEAERAREDTLTVGKAMYDQGEDIQAVSGYLKDQEEFWVRRMKAAGASQEEAELAWQSLKNMTDDDFIATLLLDDQDFKKELLADELMMREFGAHEALAKLGVEDADVRRNLLKNVGDLEAWDEAVADATLGLDTDEADQKRHELLLWLGELAAENPHVKIDAELRQQTLDAVHTQLGIIEGKEYLASIGLKDDDVGYKLLQAATSLESWDEAVGTATADLDPTEAEAARDALYVWLGELAQQNPQILAELDADLALAVAEALGVEVEELGNKEAKPSVEVEGAEEAKTDLSEAKAIVEELDGSKAHVEVDATDNVSVTVQEALDSLFLLPDNKPTTLSAEDNTSGVAQSATEAVEGVPEERTTVLSASDILTGIAAGALTTVTSIPPEWTTQLSGTGGLQGFAQNALAAVLAVPLLRLSTLTGQGNVTEFAGTALAAVLAVPLARLSTLTGTGNTAGFAGQAESAIRKVPELWESAVRAGGNVISFAQSARAALNAIPLFITTTITTVRRTVGAGVGGVAGAVASADGNILDGAGKVVAFANGGLHENHVAQISPAQTTFRVWAEPETGGEAYIPLSPAKRSRSTQILSEVASQFGYELREFAQGGVLNSPDAGGVRAGVSQTFNITNHYPQAEPNSVLVDRAMAEYGHPSFGDF